MKLTPKFGRGKKEPPKVGEYVNSQTARFSQSYVSCGVVEVHHLPDKVTQVTFAIANHLYNKANPRPAAFILWSDVVEDGNSRGLTLAKLLEKLQCGEIIQSGKEINPKTGNAIIVWLFEVDHEKFRKWYQDELANRITE